MVHNGVVEQILESLSSSFSNNLLLFIILKYCMNLYFAKIINMFGFYSLQQVSRCFLITGIFKQLFGLKGTVFLTGNLFCFKKKSFKI